MDNKEITAIDLTFGPAWARQSSEKWRVETDPAAGAKGRRRPERDLRRNRPPADGPRRKTFASGARQKQRTEFPAQAPQPPAAPASPGLSVTFIPERRGLKPLVKQFAGTRRAYSLFDIAATFLSRSEFYAAAIATAAPPSLSAPAPAASPGRRADQPAARLYQCSACKAVFTNRSAAVTHGLNRHLDLFYDKEEKDGEPPQGNFVCVARCTLSGELLGPPNYHGFNEKLQALHRARFADLPLDEYRKKIINETDPALIEEWKKKAAHKTTYRARLLPEPLVFDQHSQLAEHFSGHYAARLIREGSRFIVPATVCQELDDQPIKKLIREAWQKETHFPINMAFAIQQRFRRLGLHIFKAAKMTFVSAVRPHSINPEQATAVIRQILEWIGQNRGQTRQQLAAALAPGQPPEAEEVAGIINALVWLIDRGHVIEFMNGTLALPAAAKLK